MEDNIEVIREIDIKRQVAKGELNINANKPYANMEEKLAEYFKLYENHALIELFSNRDFDNIDEFMKPKLDDILGYATSFTDTNIHVCLCEAGIKVYESLRDPAIQIASIIDVNECKGDAPLVIWKVCRLQLTDRNHLNEMVTPEKYR